MNRAIEEIRPSLPTGRARRLIREQVGLSRSQLAALVGVSPESIYNWEKGGEPQGLHRRAYASTLSQLLTDVDVADGEGWTTDS